jgi:hypothetical protein
LRVELKGICGDTKKEIMKLRNCLQIKDCRACF